MFGISMPWTWWVGVIASAVFLVVMAALAERRVHKARWQRRFSKAFGFDPAATWTERTFQQPEVNRELKCLAQAFNALVKEENDLVNRYIREEYGVKPLRDLETYKSTHQKLLLAKAEFWSMHVAAARVGFQTKEKYADYL